MNATNPIEVATQALACTQAAFAKKMGVSPGLITLWKARGYITTKHLKKAVEVTGLPPHLLNPHVPAPPERKTA